MTEIKNIAKLMCLNVGKERKKKYGGINDVNDDKEKKKYYTLWINKWENSRYL